MGRIVERKVCYTEYYLELTEEDLRKQQKRRELRQQREISPAILEHEKRFAEHLLKCPICGNTPRFSKVAYRQHGLYSYKLHCDLHDGYGSSLLTCGDWFNTPSKAGWDWNERVRKTMADEGQRQAYWVLGNHRAELTRQQFRTLKGQIFAGDAEGAMCGLKRMMKEKKSNGRDVAM